MEGVSWHSKRGFEICTLLILSFFALLLRLYYLHFHQIVWNDSYIYLTTAETIKTHLAFSYFHTELIITQPLYPLFTAVLDIFLQNIEYSAQIISLIAGITVLFPLYFLTKKIAGKTTGYIAMTLAIVYPYFIFYSTYELTDMLFLALFTTALFTGYLYFEEKRTLFLAGTCILLSMLYLTRESGLFYVFSFIFYLGIHGLIYKEGWKVIMKRYSIFILIFTLVSGPFLLYLHNKTDTWTFSYRQGTVLNINWDKSDVLAYEHNFRLNNNATTFTYLEYDDLSQAFPWQAYIKNIPQRIWYIQQQHIPDLFSIIIIITATMGVIHLISFSHIYKKATLFYFSFFLLVPTIGYVLINVYPVRYFFPTVPIVIIFSAIGIGVIADYLSTIQRIFPNKNQIAAIIMCFLVLLIILSYAGKYDDPFIDMKNYEIEHKNAGLWLKENHGNSLEKNFLIMSRKTFVAWYSNAKHVLLPYDSYERVLSFARNTNTTFLVIDDLTIPLMRPQLAFLLDPEYAPEEDLTLIYFDNQTNGRRIVIYEVKK